MLLPSKNANEERKKTIGALLVKGTFVGIFHTGKNFFYRHI
jgi:hypothetical protein